jgi:hypothetical protein
MAFIFKDNLSLDNMDFVRIYGDYNLHMTYDKDGVLIVSKVVKTFNKLKNIISANRDKEYKFDVGIVDIETFNKKIGERELKAIPYAIGVYYKGVFKSFYLTEYSDVRLLFNAFLDYLHSVKATRIYSHNGGNFDFRLIIEHIEKDKIKSFIRGNSIYTFIVNHNKLKIQFLDSYLLLGSSLRSLCESFETNVVKGHFPHGFVSRSRLEYKGDVPAKKYYPNLTPLEYDKINGPFNLKDECLKYLEADCIGLYEVLSKFSKTLYEICEINPLNSHTISSFANKAWRKLDYDKVVDIKSYTKNSSISNDIRSAYFGGVTSVYKPYVKLGESYDVNSLYPAMMKLKEMPLGAPRLLDVKNLDDYYGFCYAKITTDNRTRGLLPYKLYGTLITPNGTWEGWYYSEELKLVKKLGYKVEVEMGYHYQRKGYVFTEFIDTFFKLKNSKDNPVYRAIGKIILNSAYGYLGLNYPDFNSELVVPQEGEKYIKTNEVDTTDRPYDVKTSVALAAIIAAESRMHVLKARLDPRTAYTDTDSVYLEDIGKLEGMDVDPKALGSWKNEGKFTEGLFIGKKQYSINRDNKTIVKTAGAPTNTFTWEDLEQVYKFETSVTKEIEKLKLEKTNMDIKTVKTEVTLQSTSSGYMKIYQENEKGTSYIGTLPLIIKGSKSDKNVSITKIYNPKNRLIIKKSNSDQYLTYEDAIRYPEKAIIYPTNIKEVKLPFKTDVEFVEGIKQIIPKI